MPTPDANGELFRYRDADQAWVYTNDLESVPEAARGSVETYRLESEPRVDTAGEPRAMRLTEGAERALEGLPEKAREIGRASKREAEAMTREVGDVLPFVRDLEPSSVAVGFATATLIWALAGVARRTGRVVFRFMGVALVAVLLAGAYMGWLRGTTGLSTGGLATPAEVVDDAKRAADKMQNRLRRNERTLRRLEETPR